MSRILIADDVEENRYLLKSLLLGNGHEVEVAANGAEALEIARRSPPDLIVTDILMPVMDGFELCQVWRQDERLKRIPFIVYTATYTDPQDEKLALQLGADRFVVKPQKPEVLIGVIHELLEAVARDPGVVRTGPTGECLELLRQHNAALRRKLDKKVADLENEIAQRKLTESELRKTAAFLSSIIENIPSMVFVKEARSLRFVEFNRAGEEFLGIPREELIGKCDYDFFPREQADFFTQKDREVLHAKRIVEIPAEPITTRKHGQRFLRTRKVPILNQLGEPEYLLGISEDITERLQAEKERQSLQRQLLQAQKMESIGRLAGGIAHDFNNILSVILSYTDFALKALEDGHPARAELQEILNAATRAVTLTRQLLAFSKKQLLEPEVLDLNRVISGIEKMLRRLLGDDIEIRLNLANDLGCVLADPTQIEQVIMNLAVNSRDAMPEGGTLTIETANVELDDSYAERHLGARAGRYVMFSVTDTGVGMDEETKSHIFEPFFTTKVLGKGTGLGLSTVYGIVKQSDGYIYVYSEPGIGTTFKIFLPRVDAVQAEAKRKHTTTLITGNETVLVVEDEEAIRRMVERILRGAGYQVYVAATGSDALDISERLSGEIDLLLTDVVLPRMSGREVADRLKAAIPALKVLFMSGYSDEALVEHRVFEPGTSFISKPFTAIELTQKVREVLDDGRNSNLHGHHQE